MQAEVEGWLSAADESLRRGDVGRALPALSRALAIDAEAAAPAYARALAGMRLTGWPVQLEADLVTLLRAASIDPQTLARAAAHMLLIKYPEPVVAYDLLWAAFLTRCINLDPAMEQRLAWLARQSLPADLREALAAQAFASEYVWGGEALGVPGWAAAELARERELAAALPRIATIGESDADRSASQAVRSQYEANPYPRWRAPPSPRRVSLAARLDALGAPQAEPLAVLVAGCGTGFEPIDLARTDPSLRITALDLSAASLAYGQRMAAALGVANVRFVQGDLLDIAALGTQFDFVSSTGVLHHMERPDRGLAALARVLKPGGVLRLALYSERARAWVAEAHRAIAEHGWEASLAGIRAFRAHVLGLAPEAPLARLRESDDFYTVSGCRDLCFHVREHRYRLPAIGGMLAAAGLELLRLEPPPGAPLPADPMDLGQWDAIERGHPRMFAGMIHFWCRK